jgi:hypothetical protein
MTAEPAAPAPPGGPQAESPSDREAERFARYLIGEPPLPEEIERYRRAVELRGAWPRTERDRALLRRMIRHPWTIGPIDAGLALADPESPLRFRLCLMLAVLEASPAHCARFLPAPYPKAALVGLAFRMAGAAARSALGLALVRTWGVLWR